VAAEKARQNFQILPMQLLPTINSGWDAFASGGSHGYDHKALGITARGAGNVYSDIFAN